MKVEYGINPNCSEAVFRFGTVDPKEIHIILQALADEISANNSGWGKQRVPLFKTAEEYDTKYSPATNAEYDKVFKLKGREFEKALMALRKKEYPKTILKTCAGLGDNECIVSIEKEMGSFVLNIGNNSISDNKTGWIEAVEALGIKVEEAEYSKNLRDRARDCCCGIKYFDGYENLVKDKEEPDAK